MSASTTPEIPERIKRRRRNYISVCVDVDVSLSDIETEDLIEELASRGITTIDNMPDNPWQRAYEALRYKPDPLPEIKQLVMDATGRLL